jgi:hypothetical protein
VRYLFGMVRGFSDNCSGEFILQDRDEYRSLIVRLQRLQLRLHINEEALEIPNTGSPPRDNPRNEDKGECEPLSDDDMLFDLESELPDASTPADDVEPAAADTPIEISLNTLSLGRDTEVWRGQVMALRSQSLASLGDDHGNELHVQIENKIRSQEARNNVNHHDAWVQLASLKIADDDAEDSSAEDEGNQGNGEDDRLSAAEEDQHDASSSGDGPRRVRGDSAGGGFRPRRMLRSTRAARPDFMQWNNPEVVSLMSSSDLEDLRTEDSAMSTYSE